VVVREPPAAVTAAEEDVRTAPLAPEARLEVANTFGDLANVAMPGDDPTAVPSRVLVAGNVAGAGAGGAANDDGGAVASRTADGLEVVHGGGASAASQNRHGFAEARIIARERKATAKCKAMVVTLPVSAGVHLLHLHFARIRCGIVAVGARRGYAARLVTLPFSPRHAAVMITPHAEDPKNAEYSRAAKDLLGVVRRVVPATGDHDDHAVVLADDLLDERAATAMGALLGAEHVSADVDLLGNMRVAASAVRDVGPPSPSALLDLADGAGSCSPTLGFEAANLIAPIAPGSWEDSYALAPRIAIFDSGVHRHILREDRNASLIDLESSRDLVGVDYDELEDRFADTAPRDCAVINATRAADSSRATEASLAARERSANGTVTRQLAVRVTDPVRLLLREALRLYRRDLHITPNEPTVLDAEVAGPRATYSLARIATRVIENVRMAVLADGGQQDAAPSSGNDLGNGDVLLLKTKAHGAKAHGAKVVPAPGPAPGPAPAPAPAPGPAPAAAPAHSRFVEGGIEHVAWSAPLSRAMQMVRECMRTDVPVSMVHAWGDVTVRGSAAHSLEGAENDPREAAMDAYLADALRAVAMSGRGGLGCSSIFAAAPEGRLSSGSLVLSSPFVLVATGYVPAPDGARLPATGRPQRRAPRLGEVSAFSSAAGAGGAWPRSYNGTAAANHARARAWHTDGYRLGPYGPNIALSAPVGYCVPDLENSNAWRVRLADGRGATAAAALVAAASARVSALLPSLPWNAVADILIHTADNKRFFLPSPAMGDASGGSSTRPGLGLPSLQLPRASMACTCDTGAVAWWDCVASQGACPLSTLRHSLFSGFGAVHVPRAVAAAERIARLMTADPRLARGVRAMYLSREAWPLGLEPSRDETDLAACTPSSGGFARSQRMGLGRVVAFVPRGGPRGPAAQLELLLEHVTVRGTNLAVSRAEGVSMWLERTDTRDGSPVRGSESLFMHPGRVAGPDGAATRGGGGGGIASSLEDYLDAGVPGTSTRGATPGTATTIKHWGELTSGAVRSWRLCVAGLSAEDEARALALRPELVLHGKQFRSLLSPGEVTAPRVCTCPSVPGDPLRAGWDDVHVVPTAAEPGVIPNAQADIVPSTARTRDRRGDGGNADNANTDAENPAADLVPTLAEPVTTVVDLKAD
jgi:hypothetical protein